MALTVWQATRQTPSTTPSTPPTVRAAQGSLAAGRDMAITGAQVPTAGRDARTVAGGAGPTAGGDIHITTITTTGPIATPMTPPTGVIATGPISNLPPRNLAFTGRDELLEHLHRQLTTPAPAAAAVAVTALADESSARGGESSQAEVHAPRVLHGLGGVGKTQLAIEYAYRHASHYQIRWWIPAEQPAAIPAQLVVPIGITAV